MVYCEVYHFIMDIVHYWLWVKKEKIIQKKIEKTCYFFLIGVYLYSKGDKQNV